MARIGRHFAGIASGKGFTLVEMLVAVGVLTILILMTSSLLSGALKTITSSRKSMDADSEARLVFARMGADFAGMLKRTDIDYLFVKQNGSSFGANDGFFFYGQAPAYFATTDASLYPSSGASDPKSPFSLIGYRIVQDYQLARMGKGLTWDNQGSPNRASSSYNSIVFLAANAGGGGWNPSTLMTGAWPDTVGAPPAYAPAVLDATYQTIGPDVFRLEFCYLLKDGTVSDQPIQSVAPPSWTTNPVTKSATFYQAAGTPPTGANTYPACAPGSRWYVPGGASEAQGYICTSAPPYTGSTATWGSLGMQDVVAVIVTIAILDPNSRKLLGDTSLGTVGNALRDSGFSPAVSATRVTLPGAAWETALTQSNPPFTAAAHIPAAVATQIRVYQRFFYLSQ